MAILSWIWTPFRAPWRWFPSSEPPQQCISLPAVPEEVESLPVEDPTTVENARRRAISSYTGLVCQKLLFAAEMSASGEKVDIKRGYEYTLCVHDALIYALETPGKCRDALAAYEECIRDRRNCKLEKMRLDGAWLLYAESFEREYEQATWQHR